MKPFLKLFMICILLAVVVFAALYLVLNRYAHSPVSSHKEPVVIEIQPGQNFDQTVAQLMAAAVIDSDFKFRTFARLKGFDRRLKAGEYLIEAPVTPLEILEKLTSGQVRLHRLTIPEGFNIEQIGKLITEQGLGAGKKFVSAANDASIARDLNIPGDSCEGYLFPDTYYFSKNAGPLKMIKTMVNRFWEIFTPERRERARSLGFTVHEVVTLASIIEKETGDAKERPMISSVFHNRLKKGMRLQSDPTVIYGLDTFDGNLTRRHLEARTPYNTYRIRGLPPGPIANPGNAALEAALHPAKSNYLYFVAKKNATHHFSTNLKDHVRAVRRYQLRKR